MADVVRRSRARFLIIPALVVLLVLVVLIFVRPSTASTGPDQVALHYKGGSFTSKRFSDCIAPSNRAFDGPGDSHFAYPASQTNYVFDAGERRRRPDHLRDPRRHRDDRRGRHELPAQHLLRADHHRRDPLPRRRAPALPRADRQPLPGVHDPRRARSDGWRQMLAVYIARPLDTAIDRAGQAYTYAELYTDPSKKAAWEQSVLDQLPGLVDRQTDGDTQFFLNFAITLQKPEPPQSIKDELVKQQAAVAAAKAAQAEAEAREAAALAQVEVEKAEAQKIQARVDVLGQQGSCSSTPSTTA